MIRIPSAPVAGATPSSRTSRLPQRAQQARDRGTVKVGVEDADPPRLSANTRASPAVTRLFPTPPLPLMTATT